MHRRTFLRNTSLSLGALAFLNTETLAQLLADPAYKIKMLNKETGIFMEKGGTILFQLNKEGIVVVDAQFPESAQHLVNEIRQKTQDPFRLLINTHHHGDHTSGNIVFKGIMQHVLAHVNSKINQQQVAIQQKTTEKQLYPDQTYTHTFCEKIGRENICLYYMGAAHTNGDSVVHFKKSNIIHLGDLVFNRRHPVIDTKAGANIQNWISLLERVTKEFRNKTVFVCGHAAAGYETVLNKPDLQAFRDYLLNLLKYTETAIKAGKSKEDLLKTTSIPGSPDWKGDGIERSLTAAYIELSGVTP